MLADIKTLHKVLQHRIESYVHQHGHHPSTPAIAQLLSNTLYYKRFFPYYTFNVLGGIDEKGQGLCCSYDSVGSFEHVKYTSSGTGNSLIQPLLDNQVSVPTYFTLICSRNAAGLEESDRKSVV